MKSIYTSLKEWKKNNPRDYQIAKYKGLLSIISKLNGWKYRERTSINPAGHWNDKQRCLNESKKYQTRNEWHKCGNSSALWARKNGWLDECCAHMNEIQKPSGYWNNFELVLAEARKYDSRGEWAKNSDASYRRARKNGWVEQCTEHMVEINKPSGYWTYSKCMEIAKQYSKRMDWKTNHTTSYQAASSNGWLIECTKHMESTRKKANFWTKDKCLADALNYTGRFAWQKGNRGAYHKALKNKWLEECCQHMK